MQSNNCKNCGAQIDVRTAVGGVVECAYCHSRFSVAKSADDKTLSYLRTAEIALELCKFDDAYAAYKQASAQDKTESEAYFGMALARFKVQYIKDCVKNRLQPICHDISEKVFSQCDEYKKAVALGSPEQKAEYEGRAEEIDYIRKEFYRLRREGNEYDCFICVKVTGEDGRKTKDSDYASELYYHLKDKGYSPFYSERVIQNKTGADYEAQILYALQSAKCMVVVCGKDEYLQTPWVKNEYTRFLSLINDERKAYDSITIAFTDAPIEKLPGKTGLIQGVDLKRPDAFGKLESFVAAHKTAEAPQITRKTYGDIKYEKKTAIQSQIVKRTLGTYIKTAITVSEQAKLDIARDMLASGNYNAAISRCDGIISTNNSCSDAYWYRFLAENGCKTAEEFVSSAHYVSSFDSLEKAIATADKKQKETYYDALFDRTIKERGLYLYSEYISLPDSTQSNIDKLTISLFAKIMAASETDGAPRSEFDAIIKTVTNTQMFIDMNREFAAKLFKTDGGAAAEYYKKVLEVDPSNEEALWCVFATENGLHTANDTDNIKDNIDAKKLLDHMSGATGRAEIESRLFGYGFNKYAHKRLCAVCTEEIDVSPEHAEERFDFLLSLVPNSEQAEYKALLQTIVVKSLARKHFDIAAIYNDRIIGEDKLDDGAYFKRIYIKNKTINPLSFAANPAALYDDPDFSAAVDSYAEKQSGEKNIYIEFVNSLTEIARKLGDDNCRFIATYYDLSEQGIQPGGVVLESEIFSKLIALGRRLFCDIDELMDCKIFVRNDDYWLARIGDILRDQAVASKTIEIASRVRSIYVSEEYERKAALQKERNEVKAKKISKNKICGVIEAINNQSPTEVRELYEQRLKTARNKEIVNLSVQAFFYYGLPVLSIVTQLILVICLATVRLRVFAYAYNAWIVLTVLCIALPLLISLPYWFFTRYSSDNIVRKYTPLSIVGCIISTLMIIPNLLVGLIPSEFYVKTVDDYNAVGMGLLEGVYGSIELENDLDFNEEELLPINGRIINGNGHVIRNFTVSAYSESGNDYFGLFYNRVVYDLTIENAYFDLKGYKPENCGVIFGRCCDRCEPRYKYCCTIRNCTIRGCTVSYDGGETIEKFNRICSDRHNKEKIEDCTTD